MRALVQRVTAARVIIGSETVGSIGSGLCVLVGVTHSDGPGESLALADKLWHLRVFEDDAGLMNLSLADRAASGRRAATLVVSQFTLYGDTSRGRRPSWARAAPPEQAAPLIDAFAQRLRTSGASVATGRFGARMLVSLVNDGPVTLLLETA